VTPDGAHPNPRSRRHPVGRRALLGYLILSWLLIRLSEPHGGASTVTAAAVLAGFPLALLAARLLSRGRPARLRGAWAVAGVATLAAMTLPAGCLLWHGTGPARDAAADVPLGILPAGLATERVVADGDDHLRLRIRGLTLAGAVEPGAVGGRGPASAPATDCAAELLLDTGLDERDGRRELVITVTLREIESGRVSWRKEYVVDPDDSGAVHATILRALNEAMRRTHQGILPALLA
jgi:hypothetical protein